MVKGAFRFVSGKVEKEEPSKMNVKTPVGTIGIRGTSAAGVITLPDPTNPGSNISGTFVLLGPGVDNNAGERAGRILVSNGGATVEITRSGFGTSISGLEGIPTVPVRFTPGQVAALTGGLGTDGGARPAGNGGEGPAPNTNGQNSGNQSPGGQSNTGNTGNAGNTGGASQSTSRTGNNQQTNRPSGGAQNAGVRLGQANNLTGQSLGTGIASARTLNSVNSTKTAANETQTILAQQSVNSVLSTVTTFEQLRSIETGTATFNAGTVNLNYQSGSHTNSGGSYGASVTIDFGARTIDLVISDVTYFFNGGANQLFVFEDNPGGNNGNFDNDTGNVAETWTTTADAGKFTTMPTDGSSVRIRAAVLNDVDANEIAQSGRVEMTIQDAGSDTVISGSATVARQ